MAKFATKMLCENAPYSGPLGVPVPVGTPDSAAGHMMLLGKIWSLWSFLQLYLATSAQAERADNGRL